MSRSPISLLLLRRLILTRHIKRGHHRLSSFKAFSTSSPDPPKPTSLSARMSFVFDQIDAIERERAEKDQTLQRIRAWRLSKDAPKPNPDVAIHSDLQGDEKVEPGSSLSDGSGASLPELNKGVEQQQQEGKENENSKGVVEVVHPWPEWIELMERLLKQNYFDHRRKDEDKMVRDLGLDVAGTGSDLGIEEVSSGIDFTKDIKTVQNACLNFGKDRFDIFRSLSRQDIQILVGYGCPSSEKKVVFSSKLLRKHAHLDEGDVCSSCSLRSACERAYLLTNKEDEARTIDVMRILITYGLDPLHGTITNKPLLKQKTLKIVVRKLMHEIVKLSAIPIDPNLPPPIIKKPPPKVKQPPPPPKKRVGRDDIEMKKGDWLCPKCDFMNFAKNTMCLQCDAKRPKRQLLPGEWECPECNFLNYRRNMVCFHCECKRPPDEFVEAKMEERQHGTRMRMEKMSRRPEVSNAWNFNFDDDESDGADVAAFEYADSGAKSVGYPVDDPEDGGNFCGSDAGLVRAGRNPRMHGVEHSDPDSIRPGMGFDDFDDEDDVDSYEVDAQSCSSSQKVAQDDFSGRGISDLKDSDSDDGMLVRPRSSSASYKKLSKSKNRKTNFFGSGFDDVDTDSDDEFSGNPKWRSSHVADTEYKVASKGPKGASRKLSFGSDEEMDIDSDPDDYLDDNFGSTQGKWNKRMYGRRNSRSSDLEDVSFSGSNSDELLKEARGQVFRNRRQREPSRRAGVADSNIREARNSDDNSSWNDDFGKPSRGSYRRGSNSAGWRMNDRSGNSCDFSGGRKEGFENKRRGGPNEYNRDMDRDFGEFRNSRRVIER